MKWGVPRGWGAGMAESGWWVDRNGLATTHLDSALCKYTIRPQFGKKLGKSNTAGSEEVPMFDASC